MAVNGANSNPTWNQVVNTLVADAADPEKFRNIKELTGKERNIVLKALQTNNASEISPGQLKVIYGKLTKTTDFKRTTSLRLRIVRGFKNLVGVRISSVNFRDEVLKSQRVVEPLSKEAIDVVTGYLTRNVMSEDKEGNLHSLKWENKPEGMKAELPANHEEVHINPGLNISSAAEDKMKGKETQVEGGSRFVTVSKYVALQEKFNFVKWLAQNQDIGAALNSAAEFLKAAFGKTFGEVEVWDLEDKIGKCKSFDFSGVKEEELQEYLQARFPDFGEYELMGKGIVTLKIREPALVIFKEFQMPEGRGMEFIKE